jgi:hypothetical protein
MGHKMVLKTILLNAVILKIMFLNVKLVNTIYTGRSIITVLMRIQKWAFST